MRPCPDCKSENIYKYKKMIDAEGGHGPDLLPKLSKGVLKSAKMFPVLCADCGLLRFFSSDEAREKLKESEHWEKFNYSNLQNKSE